MNRKAIISFAIIFLVGLASNVVFAKGGSKAGSKVPYVKTITTGPWNAGHAARSGCRTEPVAG